MPGESQPSGFFYWVRVVTFGRKPGWTFARIVTLVALTFVTFKFILVPVRVTGISMEPTFHNHSVNFINRLSYARGQPQHGDVVGIRGLAGEHLLLMKRVVGLPGETVSFSGGHVCLDGVRQDEPYLRYVTGWEVPPLRLGPDEYYVVGDNRSMRWEDHVQGAAERRQIIGKVLLPGHWWPGRL